MPKKPERSLATVEEISRIVLEVELSKQIKPPLTEQQRLQLVLDLKALKLTPEELRTLAEKVKEADTFGTISYQYWAQELKGNGETARMVIERLARERAEELIAERRKQLEQMRFNQEYIEKLGLMDVTRIYNRRLDEAIDREREKMKQRVRRASIFIRSASPEVREQIKRIAIEKKVVTENDTFLEIALPYLAPHILHEVEAMMRRVA